MMTLSPKITGWYEADVGVEKLVLDPEATSYTVTVVREFMKTIRPASTEIEAFTTDRPVFTTRPFTVNTGP